MMTTKRTIIGEGNTMSGKLLTEGAAFAHYFADCPCCGKQIISVTCRVQGNYAAVKATHWGTSDVLPALVHDAVTVQLPADLNELLTDDERRQLNDDLAEMARKRRLT
jgi:hypothetical protein